MGSSFSSDSSIVDFFKAASLLSAILCHLIFVAPVPAGTGSTKIKWQEVANLRDASLAKESSELPKESSEEIKEKQFPIT